MKKPTVTVAVSAYNEERNIIPFLESVLGQEQKEIEIKKVLVISDGSNDKTCELVRKLKSTKIDLRDKPERKGKSARLNEIYEKLNTDFLVQSDADVTFSHNRVVLDILKPMLHDSNVGMCGGNPLPLKGVTFLEKSINVSCYAYIKFRNLVRKGNNMFSADGRLLSFRNSLVKQIKIPENMTSNDKFTYFSCLALGWRYKFVKSAVVNYRSPQTLEDHIKQNTRFLASPRKMILHFPADLVKKELKVPAKLKLTVYSEIFLRAPLHCFYIFLLNRYCFFRVMYNWSKISAKWEIAKTTKTLSN